MGTLVCTIEMDKAAGLTVTITNADAKITQTIKMDGTMIELKVAGDQATSVIQQVAEKVTITCKQFEVKAEETIDLSSGKASTWKSGDALTAQSAKDMTLASDADVSVSGQKIAAEGQTEVSLSGASTSKVSLASAGATVSSGGKLELSQAQAAMSGVQVQVKADGMMSLESSGIATLKGSLTNVQGSLINLG
ncbi:hypothetical protein AB3662_17080 [Sorangium cellulosum]|uniref:hypothetical protein n=1 Tax=Sorangium cellulosum TaxID=56 RepID=UPI003D9A62C8